METTEGKIEEFEQFCLNLNMIMPFIKLFRRFTVFYGKWFGHSGSIIGIKLDPSFLDIFDGPHLRNEDSNANKNINKNDDKEKMEATKEEQTKKKKRGNNGWMITTITGCSIIAVVGTLVWKYRSL